VIRIEGCSTVIFNCRNDEHPTFTGIYYILKLKANIISVGELDEVGYDVHIASGTMQNKDADGCLLAKIPHPHNQLYVLNNDIAQTAGTGCRRSMEVACSPQPSQLPSAQEDVKSRLGM
jgi:hypothetical protein